MVLHNWRIATPKISVMFTLNLKASKLPLNYFTNSLSAMAAAGLVAVVCTPRAAEAGSLNWKFKYANQIEADVTVQANGAGSIDPGVLYTITGASGTIGAVGGVCGATCFNITGLSNYNGATNTFQYNPSLNPNDPSAFITDIDGISFVTNEVASFNIYWSINSPTLGIADSYTTNSPSASAASIPLAGSIIVAGPSAPVPSSVPGPLPIFGAGAAFGMSRRLRRRVLSSKLR